jgi:hypothetical protein
MPGLFELVFLSAALLAIGVLGRALLDLRKRRRG